jgi:hypothetical protein
MPTALADSPDSVAGRPSRSGLTRLVIGYGAIVCAVPYLALKIIWLTGGQLGVANPALMRDLVTLNIVTALMDVVYIGIVLAFTHEWGLRIPAWLLLPPMWVASGLLARFVVAVPIVTISQAFAMESIRVPPGGPVEPWVYAVVYSGFTGMGVGLMCAFALYAHARWSAVFRSGAQAVRLGPTYAVHLPVAIIAALMAVAGSAVHLAWAFGATIGLRADLAAGRTFSSYVLNAIDAAMGISAASGILLMVLGKDRRIPYRAVVTLTWIGSGFLFAWALWHLINVLGETALVRDRVQGMALVNVLSLLRLLAGLLIGLLSLFLLADRSHPARSSPRPFSGP